MNTSYEQESPSPCPDLRLNLSDNTKNEAGFTFVEVLVVTMLLAVLSFIIFGSLDGIIRGREALQSRSTSTNVARTVLERMSREISNRTLEPLAQGEQAEGSTRARFGRRELLAGENKEDRDIIRFTSSGTAQAAYGAFTNHGIVQIEYRLEEDPKGEEEDVYLLIREEYPVGVEDEETRTQGRVVFPLADNITQLNFRYLENAIWKDSWSAVALPEAVEITLKVKAENGLEMPFRTAIFVNKRRQGLSTLQTAPQ